ncbi:MAG: NfeD family protein [Epsilonproteobacteria bacterium]|nr:MAG: NfeD family protein [Campylobacterota bacterium]
MIEYLNDSVVWWHWVALGLILIISEMATGTFISLGLGVAGIVVGLIDLIVPMGFTYQLLLWIILSIFLITVLFRWFKDQPTVSEAGQSDYRFDTPGTVTQVIHPHKRGKVSFDSPVLGNRDWHANSDYELAKEARVKIIEVNGQLIKVAPLNT